MPTDVIPPAFDWTTLRNNALVVGLMLAALLLVGLVNGLETRRWKRRFVPPRRVSMFARTGIRLRTRCWSVIEGSEKEIHLEHFPAGDEVAQRRFRKCWTITCSSCGERFRDIDDELAHFGSSAQAAFAGHERGWTIAVGRVRCPECTHQVNEAMDRRLKEHATH